MNKTPLISRFDSNQITELLDSYGNGNEGENEKKIFHQNLSSALLAILDDPNFSVESYKNSKDSYSTEQRVIVAFSLHVKLLNLENNDLKLKIALAEEEKKQANDELQEMQNNFDNVIKQAKNIANNSANQEEFANIKQELEDTKKRLIILKETYDNETKEKEKLKEKCLKMQNDNQQNLSKITNALNKELNYDLTVDEIVSEIGSLKSILMKAQTDNKQLEVKQQTMKDTMKEKSTNIKDENKELIRDLKRMNKLLQSVQKEKDTLEKDNKQLTETVNNLQVTNDNLKTQVDRMNEKVFDIEKERDNLVNLLALETERELGLSDDNEKLEDEARKLRETLKKHEKTLAQVTTTERMSATVDMILEELQRTKQEVITLNNYKIRSIKLINRQYQMILYFERYINDGNKFTTNINTNQVSNQNAKTNYKESIDLTSLFSNYIGSDNVQKVIFNNELSTEEKCSEIFDIIFHEKDDKINSLSQMLHDQLLFIDAIINEHENINPNIYQSLKDSVNAAGIFLQMNSPGFIEESSIFNLLDIDEDPMKLKNTLSHLFARFPKVFDEMNNEILLALRQSIAVISVLRRFAETARIQFGKKNSEISQLKEELEEAQSKSLLLQQQYQASINTSKAEKIDTNNDDASNNTELLNLSLLDRSIGSLTIENQPVENKKNENNKSQSDTIQELEVENSFIKQKMRIMEESYNEQIHQATALANVRIAAKESEYKADKANVVAQQEKRMYDFISQIAEIFNTTRDIYSISDEKSCLNQIKLLVERTKEAEVENQQLTQYQREIEEIRSLLNAQSNQRTIAVVKSLLCE